MKEVIYLFHHIHNSGKGHEVHHCGGEHKGTSYKIKHCKCGKHSINKKGAFGHDFNNNLVKIKFSEKCPSGGWHIESGKIIKPSASSG